MTDVMSIDRLHSYPKVWNLGHPAIADLFEGEVVVQEKIDGSQFTFGVIDGTLHVRSKGATIHLPTTDKLFRGACDTAARLYNDGLLVDGWQYRGEAMMGPKHNTLAYERAPKGNVILFDVDMGREDRVAERDTLAAIASNLELECVPEMYRGKIDDLAHLEKLLEGDSHLGGMIEGVVIKNYARWGKDGKMLMGKLVSPSFREKHSKAWAKSNPARSDVLDKIQETYRSERRWEKAIQHLRESGDLTDSPQDIGPLINAVVQDVREECREEIAEILFDAFWPKLRKGLTGGLPQWYKARLAEQQFEVTP